MKKQLRAAIEAGFRRLPVARQAYAERDTLRDRLLWTEARLAAYTAVAAHAECDSPRGRLLSAEAKLAEANAALATHASRWQNVEHEVALFLKVANPANRNRLFDAFATVGLSDFLYVETDRDRFIVNARDQIVSRALFVSGEADFNKLEIAIDLLKRQKCNNKIDLLVDVGANIGSICIPAITRGLVKRAVAIEPHPTNHRLLCANIAINNVIDKITVVARAAAATDNETLTMELSRDNWGDHRIFCSKRTDGLFGEAERAHIAVQSIKMDSLDGLEANSDLLLWMDIQGYEGHALMGAQRLLAEKPPLVLEFWPYGMLRSDSFSAMRGAIAHYDGFFDLAKPQRPLRKIARLEDLFVELGPDGEFTDILVI